MSLSDAPALFEALSGSQNDHLYKYLPEGPFPDLESFSRHIDLLANGTFFYSFTIFLHHTPNPPTSSSDAEVKAEGKAVGIITYLNIVPRNRSIEIGHVLFSPQLQRTTAATESIYLLMKHAFEVLHYLRVEWKANNFNEPSKRAALRLGFVFEGVFRKHMVVKGRRRDSAWYSVVDDEWFEKGKGSVKEALVRWLDAGNFDGEGGQKRKLESFRG
jgi:RimJ/RimL family protein N-acetyltransferase